jgi:hypothetical protein
MPLRLAFDLDGVLADMDGELMRQAEILFGKAMTRQPTRPAAALADEPAATTGADQAGEAGNAGDAGGPGGPGEPGEAGGPGGPGGEATSIDTPAISKLQVTARQMRRLWQHVQSLDNFWETLNELEPGVLPRLAAIAAERRWEVIFLTKRPATAGSTAQVQTQRWLESKGFPLPSVYVVQGSRGRIAASLNLEFVIDDTPANCLDVVVDSEARAILVWRDEEKLLPPSAKRLGIGVVKTVDECLNILVQVDAPLEERPRMMARVMRLLGLRGPTPGPQLLK